MAKDLRDLGSTFQALTRFINSPGATRSLAKLARRTIYNRVKAGRGVRSETDTNTSLVKLKPLSRSYIQDRQKTGVRGEFASPKRSNLTNTGQLLNSMRAVGLRAGFKVVIPDTIRSDGERNLEVAKEVSKTRPFLNLAPQEKRIVSRALEQIYRRIVQSILK